MGVIDQVVGQQSKLLGRRQSYQVLLVYERRYENTGRIEFPHLLERLLNDVCRSALSLSIEVHGHNVEMPRVMVGWIKRWHADDASIKGGYTYQNLGLSKREDVCIWTSQKRRADKVLYLLDPGRVGISIPAPERGKGIVVGKVGNRMR
jgi:hypothetical protein